MLDNLFLVYANNSFIDDPKNIYRVFEEIVPFYHHHKNIRIKQTKLMLKYMLFFEKKDDDMFCRDLLDKIHSSVIGLGDPKIFEVPEGVEDFWINFPMRLWAAYYASRSNYGRECPDQCEKEGIDKNLIEAFKKDNVGRNIRLKCYLCSQIQLKCLLNQIISGKGYSDIYGFGYYIKKAYDCIKTDIIVKDCGKLQKITHVNSSYLLDDYNSPFANWNRFYGFLDSLVGYSLLQFLLNNDRRKLKFCPYCQNFFVSERINRKSRCYSKDCEKTYHREKKRRQREKEPDIYC